MQRVRQVDCYRLSVAFDIKNVLSCLRNTESDIFSQSAAGKPFHMIGPLCCLVFPNDTDQ